MDLSLLADLIELIDLFQFFGLNDCGRHLDVERFDVADEVVNSSRHHHVGTSHATHATHTKHRNRIHGRKRKVSPRLGSRLNVILILFVPSIANVRLRLLLLLIDHISPRSVILLTLQHFLLALRFA